MSSTTWPTFSAAMPMPLATTTATSTTPAAANPFVPAMVSAFEDAMTLRGRLKEDAYRIHGFSGRKFRLLINNLINQIEAPEYLEIGLFHGASFCPAIYSNKARAVGIDNWTEYGGTSDLFYKNLESYKHQHVDVRILESDFRKVDYKSIGQFNVLFYDGSHSEKDQFDGIMAPQPAMRDQYVMIVDDWNWERVRKGTFNALREAGLRVDYQIEVRTTFDGDMPMVRGPASEWHNGTIVAAITKTK